MFGAVNMRNIPSSMASGPVGQIDERLLHIEAGHRAHILLAIESGSRAWGFPSPDSDYDCRFIYVRKIDGYLSPWAPRDVIETPLGGELDVNGWDLGKALKLLLKGNAVVVEWLTSPLVYRGIPAFRSDLLAFADAMLDRQMVAHHYLHLGERQRRLHFTDEAAVPMKKMFYALRPAAALRWLRLHPHAAVAPMHFPALITECDPPREVAAIVADLIARKATTRELGSSALPPAIGRFIDDEFEAARVVFVAAAKPISAGSRNAADELFRKWVQTPR
jgi:uncharacterized protein